MDGPVAPLRALLDPGQLVELRARLARSRWSGAHLDGWEAGVPHAWLRALVADWERFDVAGFQDRLDALEHLSIGVDGLSVHAVHVRGKGPDPFPLVLTHGWPGSFCEYLELIPLLTDPEAYGGDAADAFDVVVPSLPGFGLLVRTAARGPDRGAGGAAVAPPDG